MCDDRALAVMSGCDIMLNQARDEMRSCRDDPEQLGYWRNMYSCAMRMKGQLALVVVAFNVDSPSLKACATLFYTLTITEKSDPLYGQIVRDLAQAMRGFGSEMAEMSRSVVRVADGNARKAEAAARKEEAEVKKAEDILKITAEELRLAEEKTEKARHQVRITAARAEEAEAAVRRAKTQEAADNDPDVVAAKMKAASAERELKAQEVRRAELENRKREYDMKSWREKHCSVA